VIHFSVFFSRGDPVALVAEGHAGFGEAGNDIVCAAVSTLLQSLVVGAEDVLALRDISVASDGERGFFSISWPEDLIRSAPCWGVLVRTAIKSLKIIESQYGDFFRISEVHESHEDI
jgi:hypothetical protein